MSTTNERNRPPSRQTELVEVRGFIFDAKSEIQEGLALSPRKTGVKRCGKR
jgi:hypothetical protein